jgi:hypothetical protein
MSDGRRFAAAGWPQQAAALGWTEENAIGLIWSLRGRRVVAHDRRKSNHHVSQRCSDVLQADGGVMTREKRLRGSWISANVSAYSPSQTLSAARSRACEGTI